MCYSDYLDQKFRIIKADDLEVQEVGRALRQVEGVLDDRAVSLGIAERYPCGSYMKKTMLKGRKEADFVVALVDFPQDDPLNLLRTEFERALSGVRGSPKHKALELSFPGGALVDVLPVAAPRLTRNYREIPDQFRRGLHGQQHTDWFVDNAHNTHIHPTVVLLKGIRDTHPAWGAISSFGIELLAVEVLAGTRGRLEGSLKSVLKAVADRPARLRDLRDPADPSNFPLRRLQDVQLEALRRSARDLLRALEEDNPSQLFVANAPRTSYNLGGRPLG